MQRANKKIKAHRFHVGDLVLDSAAKHARDQLRPKHPLAPKASGPFVIEAAIGPLIFSLDLPPRISRRFHNAFHESDLIPYILRLPTEPEAPAEPETTTADSPPALHHREAPGDRWTTTTVELRTDRTTMTVRTTTKPRDPRQRMSHHHFHPTPSSG